MLQMLNQNTLLLIKPGRGLRRYYGGTPNGRTLSQPTHGTYDVLATTQVTAFLDRFSNVLAAKCYEQNA
jgi:hypothetical protein